MIKKLLVFFLTIFTMTAYAQNVTMTGTVVDTDNLPLIGVNVVIKGTSTGTTTDLDGKFTLTGENGQTLVFSYIGMTLQEIVYKGKPLHVIMKDDSKALEEVVIIGYQTVKKSDLTGAVAVVDTKEMKKSSAGTLVSQMQGLAYHPSSHRKHSSQLLYASSRLHICQQFVQEQISGICFPVYRLSIHVPLHGINERSHFCVLPIRFLCKRE